jgi:predicted nucleic acid-binding protein
MIYFWDTNIILHTLRNPTFFTQLDANYQFFHPDNEVFVSIVSVGEIYSIALRNRWGAARRQQLIALLQQFKTIPLYDDAAFIDLYAEIDNYSQNHHPHLRLVGSARKMGKNDLWIATTATYLNATLLSTDNDFEHLNNVFLYFDKIVA